MPQKPLWSNSIFLDGITLFVSMVFGVTAALPYYFFWILIRDSHSFYQLIFLIFTFFTYPLVFLFVVAGYKKVRKIGLQPDSFSLENNPRKTYRLLREVFFNNFSMSLFLPHFNHFFGFQNLYYQWMGAKIGKGVVFGRDILIQDYTLLEIGENVTLGQSCQLSGHMVTKHGKVIQGKIKIGDNTLIGAHSFISPDVTIGANCIIGLNSYLLPGTVIENGTTLPAQSLCKKSQNKISELLNQSSIGGIKVSQNIHPPLPQDSSLV